MSLTKIKKLDYNAASKEIDDMLSDNTLFSDGKIPKLKNINDDVFDNLFGAEQVYVTTYQYNIDLIDDKIPVFLKSIELVERFLPEQKKVYAGKFLDVYAGEIEKVAKKERNEEMDDVKYLASLQMLERKFGHKTYLNVDDILYNRMTKKK